MFSKKEMWIEAAYDKGFHVLYTYEFPENTTEGRFMNSIICNDWRLVSADVNTVVMERVPRERETNAKWKVLSRKIPILHPHLPPGTKGENCADVHAVPFRGLSQKSKIGA